MATDLITSLEVQISQALKNRKTEVKVQAKPQAPSVPAESAELTRNMEQLDKQNTEKLNKIKNEWMDTQRALFAQEKLQDKRYDNLMSQYRELYTQYNSLHDEIRSMQSDFTDALKRKDAVLNDLLANKNVIQKTLEEKDLYIRQIKMQVRAGKTRGMEKS